MMILVGAIAAYFYTNTSDLGINRASVFALTMSIVGLAYFGYRIGKDVF